MEKFNRINKGSCSEHAKTPLGTPIGVSPAWYVIPGRIKELGEGIARMTEHKRMCLDKEITGVIREWASEIIGLCDTLDKISDSKLRGKTIWR